MYEEDRPEFDPLPSGNLPQYALYVNEKSDLLQYIKPPGYHSIVQPVVDEEDGDHVGDNVSKVVQS